MKPNVDGLKVDFALSLIDIASEDDGVFKLIMWPKLVGTFFSFFFFLLFSFCL